MKIKMAPRCRECGARARIIFERQELRGGWGWLFGSIWQITRYRCVEGHDYEIEEKIT